VKTIRQYIIYKINKLKNIKGYEVCFSKPDCGLNQPFLKDRPSPDRQTRREQPVISVIEDIQNKKILVPKYSRATFFFF
jgi:hypothetical protein